MTTCEAHLPQLRVVDYGFERIRCHQWRGLRSFIAGDGQKHHACPAPGHLADVTRRFGRAVAMTEGEARVMAGNR